MKGVVDWLTVLGIGLQLVGTLTAARGLWRTWREFADPGEGLLDPLVIPARAAWRRLAATVDRVYRRLFRRPGRSVTAHAGVATGAGAALNARGRVGYVDLAPDMAVREVLHILDRRTHELMDRVNDARDAIDDGLKEVRGKIGDLSTQLDEAVAGLERQTRQAAIGGIRWAALGLSLVAVGTLLEVLGAVF